MENTIALSAPWVEYFDKLETLFHHDPEVTVTMIKPSNEIQVRVDNQIKADALDKLLPHEVSFGNVTINITVIPANGLESKASLLRNALNGNPVVHAITDFETVFGNFTCVSFEPVVAQYFNDNMRDPNGITTTIYQELAKEIFGEEGDIVFCTEDDRVIE